MTSKNDLSWKEDLNVGIMNLISIEEHSAQSYVSSGNDKWIKVVETIRKIRTRWLQVSIDEIKGEYKQFYVDAGDVLGVFYWVHNEKLSDNSQIWCISKHLLGASMRGFEVGNKFYEMQGSKEGFIGSVKKGFGLSK